MGVVMVGVVRRSGGCGHGGCSEEVMVGVVMVKC